MDLENPTPAVTEINNVDHQARKVKVLTAVSVIVFVTSIILTGCLVHQKQEHQRIIQEREAKESILVEQLKQEEDARTENKNVWNNQLSELTSEKGRVEQDLQTLRMENGNLRGQLAVQEGEKEYNEEELQRVKAEVEEFKIQRANLEGQIRTLEMLRTIISEKDDTLEELLDTIEELTTSKDALEADYERLQDEFERLWDETAVPK